MSRRVSLDSAQSSVRSSVARGISLAVVTGIDECAAEGRPLTQLQQIDLVRMAVMANAEADEGCANLDTWSALETAMRARRRRAERERAS